MRDGLAPAACLPSMQGAQGDETLKLHPKPHPHPPPSITGRRPAGAGTSETCTFAEI